MMLSGNAIARAAARLPVTAFYRTAHQKIFAALVALHAAGTPATLVTVCHELKRTGELEVAGGRGAIADILEWSTTAANVAAHADVVLEVAHRRELHDLAGRWRQPERYFAKAAADLVADFRGELAELARRQEIERQDRSA